MTKLIVKEIEPKQHFLNVYHLTLKKTASTEQQNMTVQQSYRFSCLIFFPITMVTKTRQIIDTVFL